MVVAKSELARAGGQEGHFTRLRLPLPGRRRTGAEEITGQAGDGAISRARISLLAHMPHPFRHEHIPSELPLFRGESENVLEEIQNVQRYYLDRNILLVPVGGSMIDGVGENSQFSLGENDEIVIKNAQMVRDTRKDGTLKDIDVIALPIVREGEKIRIASFAEVKPEKFEEEVEKIRSELKIRRNETRRKDKKHPGPKWSIEAVSYITREDKKKRFRLGIPQMVSRFDIYSPDTQLPSGVRLERDRQESGSKGHLVLTFSPVQKEISWNVFDLVNWKLQTPNGELSIIGFPPRTVREFYKLRVPLVKPKDFAKIGSDSPISRIMGEFERASGESRKEDYDGLTAYRWEIVHNTSISLRIKRFLLRFGWEREFRILGNRSILEYVANGALSWLTDKFRG